jgi:hypothetical protein
MAIWAAHRDQGGPGNPIGQGLLLLRAIQPVCVDRHDQRLRRHSCQRRSQAAAAVPDVVGVHRLGQHDVGTRVEAPSELRRVVIQVRLDREPAARSGVLPRLGRPPEPRLQLERAAIGDVRDPAGDPHPGCRPDGREVVVAAVPIRIGDDSGDLRGAQRYLLRRCGGARREQ